MNIENITPITPAEQKQIKGRVSQEALTASDQLVKIQFWQAITPDSNTGAKKCLNCQEAYCKRKLGIK